MSILFESSDKVSEKIDIFDEAEFRDHSVGDQLIYWTLMFLSTSIMVLLFWKLINILI